MRPATQLVHFDAAPGDPLRPSTTPLYQTATFVQESPDAFGRYDYTRSGNPTRDVLEAQLAALEGARHALAYASGVSALSAVFGLAPPGSSILAGDDLYGGTVRLLAHHAARRGLAARFADPSDPAAFAAHVDAGTRLVHVETPTNPRLRTVDIAALRAALDARAARLGDAPPLLSIDNTLLTPWLLNPLDHGADLVVHSATKALGGHGDLTAGAVVTRDAALADELAFARNAEGTALAPFEAFLLLRGLKTLAVRLAQQQRSAALGAALLATLPGVRAVHVPHGPAHARQARGSGPVVSVEFGSAGAARAFATALRLFALTVSFGSVTSSVCYPRGMSHASIPPAQRTQAPPDTLVRLSFGLEDPADLLDDLAAAARAAHTAAAVTPAGCSGA